MVIRRRGVTDIAWVFARLEMVLELNQRETALVICLRQITA